jgi:hypothetical protein
MAFSVIPSEARNLKGKISRFTRNDNKGEEMTPRLSLSRTKECRDPAPHPLAPLDEWFGHAESFLGDIGDKCVGAIHESPLQENGT